MDRSISIDLPKKNCLNCKEISVNRLPDIINDNQQNPNITCELKRKHLCCNKAIPTIEFLLETDDTAQYWGDLNEIEYSTNIKFEDVTIDTTSDCVKTNIRYYFNNYIDVFFDENILSTTYFEKSRKTTANIFTRIDYGVETKELDDITVKVKVCKKAFQWNNVSYKLTGSIEIKLDDFKPIQLEHYTRKRYFAYWMLRLIHRSNQFIFRIAFRRNSTNNNDDLKNTYQCNIECEDSINPADFIECADLLYKYYKQQYIENDKLLKPIVENITNIENLTKEQQLTLNTFQLLPYTDINDNLCVIEPQMMEFIHYLGIETYMNFVPNDKKSILNCQTFKYEKIKFLNNENLNYINSENCNVYFDDDNGNDADDDDDDDANETTIQKYFYD